LTRATTELNESSDENVPQVFALARFVHYSGAFVEEMCRRRCEIIYDKYS
jgi:hypothetical protein